MPGGIPFIYFCLYFLYSSITFQMLEIFHIHAQKPINFLLRLFKVK